MAARGLWGRGRPRGTRSRLGLARLRLRLRVSGRYLRLELRRLGRLGCGGRLRLCGGVPPRLWLRYPVPGLLAVSRRLCRWHRRRTRLHDRGLGDHVAQALPVALDHHDDEFDDCDRHE